MNTTLPTHIDTPRTLAHRFIVLFIVVVPFLAVLFAIWRVWNRWVDWYDIALMIGLYVLITMGGVTIGLHRFFTHRSFKTVPAIKYILGALAEMSLQGGIVPWVADHRLHHQFSDKEGDLHSPTEGLWHAHVGWFIAGQSANQKLYAPDLLRERWIMLMDKMWYVWWILSIFTIPFALGGWTGVLWAGLVRIFLVHHATWSINSICHTFGERPFATSDTSGNVWWLAWVTFGEANHNTHHAFPASARHGTSFWNDPSFLALTGLEKVGLVWDMILPKDPKYEEYMQRVH